MTDLQAMEPLVTSSDDLSRERDIECQCDVQMFSGRGGNRWPDEK